MPTIISEARKSRLTLKRPDLLEKIHTSEAFFGSLIANGVYKTSEIEDLKELAPSGKTSSILDHLLRGTDDRYEGFIKALKDTDQLGVLCLLEESNTLHTTSFYSEAQGARFRSHRQYYKESLGNIPFSENSSRACFDLEDVFTDPHFMKVGAVTKAKHLTTAEVLQCEEGDTLAVLIVGKKGTGKSAFLKHCATNWARGTKRTTCVVEGFALRECELVVFIEKAHEEETWKETFLKAVKGSTSVKEQAWNLLQSDGLKVAILLDELNEFTNQTVIADIFELVVNRHCHMVIASQTGHEWLKGRVGHFRLQAEICALKDDTLKPFITNYANVFIENENVAQKKDELLAWFDPKRGTNQLIGYQIGGTCFWPQAELFKFLVTKWQLCKRDCDGGWTLEARLLRDRRLCGS